MRYYSDCKEALNEIVRDVFSRGQECFDKTVQGIKVAADTHTAKELFCYDYTILKPTLKEAGEMVKYADKIFSKKHFTTTYAREWLEEMIIGGLNPGKAHVTHWPEYWTKYSEVHATGKFAYTYSERIGKNLDKIIERLKDNKYRRAAFLPIWSDVDIDRIGKRRVPCSIGYHFIIRNDGVDDRLHVIYYQRSCSLAEFYPFDVYRAVGLMQYVATTLKVKPGNLTHCISSLHCFYKDLKDIHRVW